MVFRYLAVFLLGFALGIGFLVFEFGSITGFVVSDLEAPSDWVSEDDIVVLGDKVILNIDNATLSSYVGTGSMRPFLDEGANGVRVVPFSAGHINIGDIVSYRVPRLDTKDQTGQGKLIVHRVVDRGVDGEGVYFVMQGDDNYVSDGKIRFDDIEYVTVAVIF
jgi:hypothetical protein